MKFTTLVSCEQLAQHLDDPHWIIFDCRFTLTDPGAGRRTYSVSHIPGARYADLNEDLSGAITATSGRHPLPEPAVLAEKLGRWGVDAQRQVVVYDDSFGSMAVRMWWLLRWLGHDAVALLDGGLPIWKREGRPLTAELPQITPVEFHARPDDSMWVDAGRVEHARQQGELLVDARGEERFIGLVEPLDKVAGHIPGSLNRPFEDNLDMGGTFLGAEELRESFAELLHGAPPDKSLHLCGSGITACHNLLAMEIAGLPGGKLYPGSWSEWITDPSHPVTTGD